MIYMHLARDEYGWDSITNQFLTRISSQREKIQETDDGDEFGDDFFCYEICT